MRKIGLVVAALLVVGLPTAAEAINEPVPPHLPTEVNAPGTWSGDDDLDGPLAALGVATRTRMSGLTGKSESLQLFGVSADDGRATWVDLPDVDEDEQPLDDRLALSPDGTLIGWTRVSDRKDEGENAIIEGWSVFDTVTGKARSLDLPTQGRAVENLSALTFSGDSRYLVASYDSTSRTGDTTHYLAAWNTKTGAPTVLDATDARSVPNVGSAPSGVVWTFGSTIFREDPATSDTRSFTLTDTVLDASWAPDDRAFAYLSRSKKNGRLVLHAGRTLDEARGTTIPLDVEPKQLLGWRSDEKLVVGRYRDKVQVVDITTGDARTIDLNGKGKTLNPPLLASALWQEPLKAPVVPSGTSDPRRTYYGVAGGLVLLLALGGAFRRRRPGARPDETAANRL